MADIQTLTYNNKFEECIHPIDFNDGATTGDYVDMRLYDGVTVFLYCATIGTAPVVTVQQCTQDADAGSDVKAFSSAKTITGVSDTIGNVNVPSEDLDADNNFRWLKITCSDPGSAALGCVFVVGYRARYAEASMPALV